MKPEIGGKYLITTDSWFYAPDGNQYRAAFGTVTAIEDSQQTLGVKTNAKSTNWYVRIGCLIIAGCQIHYCLKTDDVNLNPVNRTIEHEGKLTFTRNESTDIFYADVKDAE